MENVNIAAQLSSIRKYFTQNELNDKTDYEIKQLSDIKENYLDLIQAGELLNSMRNYSRKSPN